MPELTDEIEAIESNPAQAAPPEPEPIFVRYIGDGAHYLAGIPARDMTRAEWDALGELEQKRALDVKPALYEMVTKDEGRRTKKAR